MTRMEFIPELIGKIDPAVLEAGTKGLATAIGKVAGEAGIKLLGGTGEKFWDSTGKLTQKAQDMLFRISRKYIDNYTERHGILKVLGMFKPVSLDSVYTAVKLLNPEELQTFESIEGLESAFRENNQRSFQSQECPKNSDSGITVANNEQYLMVLGSPGMGKTTFLRKVGLEALKRNKGAYKHHNCIPVLLELKTFRSEINLEKAIASEFANCGLPEYEQLTKKFLDQGKLLILLDGLDEVPSDYMSKMVTAIQNFVDRYSKNRFITSCRIAAYRNNFRRFTDVAIANFDDEQIKNFINNWFESNPERGKECWDRLNSGNYEAAKELATTPLLLTYICKTYQKEEKFPQERTSLYDKISSILLEEWDSQKVGISRDSCYKQLDTRLKELLLGELAFNLLCSDSLLPRKQEISKEIEDILHRLLPNKNFIDGYKVLKDIEIQHGLLVERASGFYSFSYLSIQEYFAAKYVYDNDEKINFLIKSHLYNPRWREVFVFVTGLHKNADSLLLKIEKEIHSLTIFYKLRKLLIWVKQVTDSYVTKEMTTIGKKATAIFLAIQLDYIQTEYRNFSDNFFYNIKINLLAKLRRTDLESIKIKSALELQKLTLAKFQYFSKVQALAREINNDRLKNLSIYVIQKGSIYSNAEFDNSFTNYLKWSEEFKIYKNIDYSKLTTISNEFDCLEFQSGSKNRKAYRYLVQKIVSSWQRSFRINTKLFNLSDKEIEILTNFFYGNLLMIKCKQAAVRLSPDVWEGIESRMLVPVNQ